MLLGKEKMENDKDDKEQQFCLRWNNFQANITSQFETLRDDEDFVDVTLACEGKHLKAHKVVLSACSPYFKELFKSTPCQHPIVFMQDVEHVHLMNLLEFMYTGEVNVSQAHLPGFLRTAEVLQIRGLAEASQQRDNLEYNHCSSSDLHVGNNSTNAAPFAFWQALSQTLFPNQIREDDCDMPLDVTTKNNSSNYNNSEHGTEGDVYNHNEDTRGGEGEDMKDDNDTISESAESEGEEKNTSDIQMKIAIQEYDEDDINEDEEQQENSIMDIKEALALEKKLQAVSGDIPAENALNSSVEGIEGVLDSGGIPGIRGSTTLPYDMRPYNQPRPCPYCPRILSHLGNWKKHVITMHFSREKTQKCRHCQSSFRTPEYLQKHLVRVHKYPQKWRVKGHL